MLKERKGNGEPRIWGRERREETGDKQEGGERNNRKLQNHRNEGRKCKMQRKIKDKSAAIFHKHFLMSRKRGLFFYPRSEVVVFP